MILSAARRALFRGAFAICAAACVVELGPSAPSTSDGGTNLDGLTTATVTISAATGGSVRLPDGTALEVPAGALAADTAITMGRPSSSQSFSPSGALASILLLPEGLTFKTPAKLTIPYSTTGLESGADLVVATTSTLNTKREVGGEQSIMEPVTSAERGTDRFTVPVSHFTIFHIFYVRQMYVTPVIPGRYLRSGDILYSLTSGESYKDASFFPMHVGLFFRNGTKNAVVESTVPTAGCPTQNGVSIGSYEDECGFPYLKGQHIFAGLRRPNWEVTEEQGNKAIESARGWVDKVGYGIVGMPNAAAGGGMTCVQLAEVAWAQAGATICHSPDIMITPEHQLTNTVPVNRISIKVSDGEVRIPIVVAARTATLPPSYTAAGSETNGSTRLEANVTMTVDDSKGVPTLMSSGRARLEAPRLMSGASGRFSPEAVRDLVLSPTKDDLGNYVIALRVEVPSRGYVYEEKSFLSVGIENGGYEGSSAPDDIGCIPCDGQARFMAPGQPGVALGSGENNPAALQKSVALESGGKLGHLKVTATSADGGIWTYTLWVNGSPSTLGCKMDVGSTLCSYDGEVAVKAGDKVTVAVGNPGAPFSATAGRGKFQVSYSFTLTP